LYVALVALTVPFVGAVRPEQVTGAHVGAMPLNDPSEVHVLDAAPTRL
jgi:hypothetical protein